jgi:hypothetical protein
MSPSRAFLTTCTLCLLAVAGSAQQQCLATHDDNLLKTDTTMGGPNLLLGMRYVAPRTVPIIAIEVITGRVAGANAVSIWSHDAAGDKPLAMLGGRGTWTSTTLTRWQGALLPSPIVITQSTVYWIVWEPQNGAQASLTTAAGTIPYRGSFDGGKTWSGQNNGQIPWPANGWKLRLYCPYQTGTVTAYGTGKQGGGAIVPLQAVEGYPSLGNEIRFVLSRAMHTSPALLVLGQRVNLPLPVGTLLATPLVIAPTQTSTGRNPGDGNALLPLRIPNDTALQGLLLALQWWVIDSGATFQLAHTDGSEVKLN